MVNMLFFMIFQEQSVSHCVLPEQVSSPGSVSLQSVQQLQQLQQLPYFSIDSCAKLVALVLKVPRTSVTCTHICAFFEIACLCTDTFMCINVYACMHLWSMLRVLEFLVISICRARDMKRGNYPARDF